MKKSLLFCEHEKEEITVNGNMSVIWVYWLFGAGKEEMAVSGT